MGVFVSGRGDGVWVAPDATSDANDASWDYNIMDTY